MLKIGIIGIGNMGSSHAKNIAEGRCAELELCAVADINPKRLEWARENLPESVVCCQTAEQLLSLKELEAVIVAVPHYDHPKYAIAAMRQGLHVMVEKPAGVYTAAVRMMNECADSSNVVFGMMFNQRTNPLYIEMKRRLSSGEMGSIRRVNWIITDWYRTQYYYDSGAWRATWSGEGGGVLLNQCPHQLDLLQWICGLPVKVHTKMHFGKWHDIEVEDDVSSYLEFENGATGVFITTTGDTPGSNRFEITTDRGKLVAEDGVLKMWKSECTEPEWRMECKKGFDKPHYEYTEYRPEDTDFSQHCRVLDAFAAAVLHGTPLIANGQEGIRGLTLSNAMHLSAFTDAPVSIPFDEQKYYKLLQQRVATSRRKTSVNNNVESDMSRTFGG